VRLREELAWQERKPLFGKRIVVTRPRTQASELAERLEDLGAEVIPLPTIEIVPPESYAQLDAALRRPADFDWLLFTSANGVSAFFERLRHLDLDVRAWHPVHIAAIGPQTADALRRHAVRVDLTPQDFRAEGLVESLLAVGVAGKRFLLPRAAEARELLPSQLRQHGAHVEVVESYRSLRPAWTAERQQALLDGGRIDLLTFTSSSTVHNFAALLGDRLSDVLRQAQIGCIGPITAATARDYGMQVAIQPAQYTIAAFVEAIVSHYRPLARG
jgi:uroporphyrinogen III methyltransferase/synthase